MTPEDQEVEIEFVYFNSKLLLRSYVSCTTYLQALRTGMLDGKQLDSIRVFYVEEPTCGRCNFVYSFVEQKKGLSPWTLNHAGN